ncbi:MAG: hypothetical protein HXY39_05895 [Chloroflexi bacterium]|nr:hypothetical protein [Chloroflexota bacterium]
MKIRTHPRMGDIHIGDEVYSYRRQLFARVEEVFPAAVCVKLAALDSIAPLAVSLDPQLWRADDIENLSVCRYCGGRERLHLERETGIPFRICERCCVVPPRDRSLEQGRWW